MNRLPSYLRSERTGQKYKGGKIGQGLVEFMLVLPVLLLITMGVVEAGRMFAIYSMISSSSREAARYGASVGDNGSGIPRYLDCTGMRAAARRVAVLSQLADTDIQIRYDRGSSASPIATCDSNPKASDIELGDRVVVTVNGSYQPIVPLVPIPPQTLTSSTARTILKEIAAGPTATLGGAFYTATKTNTPDPSATATITPTASITPTPSSTPTPGPTFTPSITPTASMTPTPLPVPQNFNASVNCTGSPRNISFNWSAVSGADYYAIYRVDPPPTTQIVIDSNPPCNNCDVLPVGETSRTYHITAWFDSLESDPSATVTVTCP